MAARSCDPSVFISCGRLGENLAVDVLQAEPAGDGLADVRSAAAHLSRDGQHDG
jgi:hypothetical protein